MKNIFIFIIYIFIFNISIFSDQLRLTQKEKKWIEQHPVIKVSNELDWAPFDYYKDKKAKGYSVNIIKEISKKAGLKVEFIQADTWVELLEKFDNKQIDLMHVMSWTKARDKKYLFSKPYMSQSISYLVRDDSTNTIEVQKFDGKKIAVGKGWSSTEAIKKMYPKAKFIEFPNSLKILEALSLGKVDIAIDNILTAKHFMAKHFITNIKHGGYIDIGELKKIDYYFVTHKNNPELISILDKAYSLLSTDEKLKLQKKWFSEIENKKISLSEDEYAYLKNKKIIKMCIDPNWMPFEKFNYNGKHVGMTAEYFDLLREMVEIPIKVIKSNTWAETVQLAKARKCDIYSLAMETPERKKYMDFTSPYLSIPLVLATQMDVPFISDMKHIENKNIGIVKDYAFNEIIRRKYPNINVFDVKNINDGLQKVANGELFGFIGTIASIGYVFQHDYIGELKITGKFDEKWELGIGTRNDEPLLLGIFQKAINSISDNEHQNILNKFIAIKYEKGTDYDLVIKILVTVFILASIGLYFYRRLSLTNKELKLLQHKLVEQANRDPLTNLYNRRYIYDVASNLLNIAKREKTDVGIIMIDIDNFKQINDNYGHAVGDEVIKKLSNILTLNTRESDIIARFGGEEFVILLPHTDAEGSTKIASKLRKLVEKENFTVSLGVDNILYEDKDIDESLNRADKALYKAKEDGKNQVCVYGTLATKK